MKEFRDKVAVITIPVRLVALFCQRSLREHKHPPVGSQPAA